MADAGPHVILVLTDTIQPPYSLDKRKERTMCGAVALAFLLLHLLLSYIASFCVCQCRHTARRTSLFYVGTLQACPALHRTAGLGRRSKAQDSIFRPLIY
jgi:hypothetical protein